MSVIKSVITKLLSNIQYPDIVSKINELVEGVNNSQEVLISGTNIKTVNNTSLLGSGNIDTNPYPSQSGNTDKFLTTNGTSVSWANASNVIFRDWSVQE